MVGGWYYGTLQWLVSVASYVPGTTQIVLRATRAQHDPNIQILYLY